MKIRDKILKDPRVIKVWDEGSDGVWASLKRGYISPSTETSMCHEWAWKDLLADLDSVIPKVEYFSEDFIKIKLTEQQKEIAEWLLGCPCFAEVLDTSLNDFMYEYDMNDRNAAEKIQTGLSDTIIHDSFLYISKNETVISFALDEMGRLIDMTENEGIDEFLLSTGAKSAQCKVNAVVKSIRNLQDKIKH